MTVIALHRDLFSTAPHVYNLPEGASLLDMAARVTSLPEGWPRHEHDAICINGHPVPQALWGMVKPKPSAGGVPVEVTFHAPPMGGGGGGKNILGIVASIGLLVLSGGVANAVSLFAGAAPGSTAAILGTASKAAFLGKLAGAAVLIGGSALLQALAPTPSVASNDDGPDPTLGSASAQGNVLEPNAALPRIVGTRKIFPPFVTEPLVYYEGDDEVVEAIVALAGPHELTDIRVGAAQADELQGVEIETREGWPGVDPLTLITRYGRTRQLNSELRGHTVSDDDGEQLQTITGNILDALPQAKVLATRDGQDAFWIGINFPQGLFQNAASTTQLRVPFRLRIRQKGDTTWINLPEVHFKGAKIGEIRTTIKLAWRDGPVNVSAASSVGWVEARIVSPGQAITPTTSDWVADSYFDANTGGDHYVTTGNAGSTDVINVIMSDRECEFQLDRATFPAGIYEVEIRRGYTFENGDYTAASYQISGSVRDPFFYEGTSAERIFQTRDDLSDKVFVARTNAVWNEAPVQKGNVAIIAVRARNVALDQLSVVASGYVRDWDGSGWVTWTTTSNPAPHLRDILAGTLNATPLPEAIIDNESLLDFRTDAWECNAIIEGQSVGDATQIVAGSGFARLYQSETFGVVRDYDRSADDPVQIFTPNNSANFSWSRGYPKLPDGFRASFVDADADYETRQIIHPVGASRTEQVTIEGLVTEAAVRERLDYDLATAKYRAGFYSWDAASEAIKCRRGSLVGLASDVLSDRVFTGRVTDYDFDGSGDLAAVRLENEPDLTAEPTWADIDDMNDVENMALIGATFGLVLRRAGKVATTHQITVSGLGADWVELSTPADPDGLADGDIAAVGPLGQEFRRLIVLDMVPRSLTEWTITAVPEAPEIWQ